MEVFSSQILDFKMFSLLLIILMSVDASQPRCGYDSCPKPKVKCTTILQICMDNIQIKIKFIAHNRRGC